MQSGLSQTDLAALMGLKPSNVSGWETGVRLPRPLELRQLSEICGCTTDWLLCLAESPTRMPIGEVLIDTQAVRQILKASTEEEIEELMDWEPEMITFWYICRRDTRVGTRQEVDSLSMELNAHVQKVSPRIWDEYFALRRAFRKRHDYMRDLWKSQDQERRDRAARDREARAQQARERMAGEDGARDEGAADS